MKFAVNPGSTIGMYTIKKALNKGGMAHVVLASANNKEFALKITNVTGKSEIDEQNNNATLKEAHLLEKLDHNRIVKIHPLSLDSDAIRTRRRKIFYARAKELPGAPWFYAMEYLSGDTLSNYVAHCGPLTVPEATNIAGNVGLGLGYLHNNKIAHLDVKPENVVFRKKIIKGNPYDPVLIDFGTAAGVKRFIDEAGSWYVMSPERVRGATGRDAPEVAARIDPLSADIWSLGILLYQALTKTLPFPSSDHRRLTSQILNDIPVSLIKQNRHIPKDLDDFVIDHCLSKRPEDRPTINDFLNFVYGYSGRGVPAISIRENYYGRK